MATRSSRRGAWGIDGDGRPITTQTPFLLGSTSKSFTALAVAQLVEAGRVDLDTTASTYLPWLRLGDQDTARRVTVRQLLTHTSGLPQVWSTDLTDRYDNRPGALARSVHDLASVRPTAAVGQTYQYSDANYMILGALVENVTGDTFGGYLRRHVLDPLQMTHSAATADEARAVGIPAGHRYYFGRPQRFAAPFDTAGVPYGFLAASLDDLSHYVIAQLSGGRYGDTRILGPQSTRQLHRHRGHRPRHLWVRLEEQHPGRRRHPHRLARRRHPGLLHPHRAGTRLEPRRDHHDQRLRPAHGRAAQRRGLQPCPHPARRHTRDRHRRPDAGLGPGRPPRRRRGATRHPGLVLDPRPPQAAGDRVPPARSGGRTIAATVAWVGACAAVAACVAWQVPAFWKGAGLAKLQLWAPDVGHAIRVVVALAAALALTRLALGVHAIVTARPVTFPWHERT